MGLSLNNIPNKGTETTQASPKAEAEKVVAAASVAEPTFDEGILGSKSGTIEFVRPIGDPSRPDVTTDKNGNKSKTPYIVGYRLKALEDMEVPHCGLAEDARKNLMSFVDKNAKIAVKAGEEFMVTRFDAGLLLASPEFNGRINGGGKGVSAVYQVNTQKSAKGTLGDASAATNIPTVALKTDTGSIKDYEIEECLTFEVIPGEGGVVRKSRHIKPAYEYFANLCIAPEARARSAGSSKPKNARNKNAQAFLDIVSKK